MNVQHPTIVSLGARGSVPSVEQGMAESARHVIQCKDKERHFRVYKEAPARLSPTCPCGDPTKFAPSFIELKAMR
jgi:hypothetical protein